MHTPTPRAHTARIEFHRKTGRIHPRSVSGRFNSWRWAMIWLTQIIFYGACWLEWDGRQALLFDIAERKFHLFGLVLWPQDALLLAVLLVLAATGLFLVTAVAGRLFCGFACPQTVYTAIFRWVESKVEGDHLARMKLDAAPASAGKLVRKGVKHALWLAIALWTGISFVGYFTPVRELLVNLGPGELGSWEGFWVLFYAGFTYLQAGFAREMVCLHMCPYSRFQGVMFDASTVTVGYDAKRGEPRKGRSRGLAAHASSASRGDCVDCSLCVQVCPTGIDIRDGLQYQCIDCGLCIDACDDVMTRVGAPTGLIRFASGHELDAPPSSAQAPLLAALRQPRSLVYVGVLAGFAVLGTGMLANRVPLQVDVLRDRNALMRERPDGGVENTYMLKVVNMLEEARTLRLHVRGPADARIIGEDVIHVAAGSVLPLPVTVAALPAEGLSGVQPLVFEVEALDGEPDRVSERSSFVMP